jgi:adenylate cyclase class 2
MAHNGRETEIKLEVPDEQAARRLLRAAGFRVSRRRVFERNTVFDTPGLAMRKAGTLLRIREAGGVATVTYKGRADVGRHKSREEVELQVADAAAMGAVFEQLGLAPVWRYEKYRTEFRQGGARATGTRAAWDSGRRITLPRAMRGSTWISAGGGKPSPGI